MNHFADISDAKNGITLSNRDAYFMKTGNSTVVSLDYKTSKINVLAAGQLDKDKGLGIENQDGDSYFEHYFTLRPYIAPFDAAKSMKSALEHQNPLVAGKITSKVKEYGSQFSLFTISYPNVVVWAVKPAEEGIENSIIVRVLNLGSKDSECTISSERLIQDCYHTTHIEKDGEAIVPSSGNLKTEIGHNRIQTFRIFLK